MESGLFWRIVAVACLLFLAKEWMDRPKPETYPVTIAMSEPEFVRDARLGSAYVEFRSVYRPSSRGAPRCEETPQFTVERRAGKAWLPMQTVRRDCAPLQFDGSLDRSVTWHTRLRVPGRYRIKLVYRRYRRAWLVAGPTFTIR